MEIEVELEKLLIEAKGTGLTRQEVLDVLKIATVQKPTAQHRSKFFILSFIVCITAIIWVYTFGFQNPNKIKSKLFGDICIMDHTAVSLEFVRPITNCTAMCKGMKEVPRYSSITREEFLRDFAYTGRPLVVTGATKNWTALNVFGFDYFKKLYSKYDAFDTQDDGNCQFFGYKTNFDTLEDVFGMSRKRAALKGAPWYIGWSNCHTRVMKEVRKHYSKPEFLPVDSETSQQDWFFMGGAGPGAPVHIDTVERPSWQAQISGKKSWSLIPPAECEDVCFPVNVTMNTGDIVVVDTNQWYHSTYIHQGQISITVGAEYD